MSKADRLLEKLCAKPIPSDYRWADLVTVLQHLGYELQKGGKSGGSRRKFYHREKDLLIHLHEPHPVKLVDKGAVKDVAEHLKANGFI